MNAILDVIAREAEKGSIRALRDYAVTLFYLFSGLRRNELFGLRGNGVELLEGGLIIRYQRKGGKHQRREVRQADVREALDHENQATTRVYVNTITVKSDKQSDRIARRIRSRRSSTKEQE
ncbi:MAG TPA: hypothetical protein VJ302_00895 [Blastocatellia bacterium]|nr:hypothetical protein [Blastocatellia bacterium]